MAARARATAHIRARRESTPPRAPMMRRPQPGRSTGWLPMRESTVTRMIWGITSSHSVSMVPARMHMTK